MNWSAGFRASYHAYIVDPQTWKDQELFEIESGSINRISTGLRESADLKSIDYDKGSDKWVRVYLDAYQDGDASRDALFTGLVSAPQNEITAEYAEGTLQCYSVLKPAQDVLLDKGWYAAKGFVAAEQIVRLLEVCPAPVTVEGTSPRLKQHIIAEQGETHLTMVDKILTAIGWRLVITGEGGIIVCPKSDNAVHIIGSMRNDVITSKIKRTHDWFDCPNVFRAISGEQSAVARDDDSTELSVKARGREVWKEETGVTLTDGESLKSYAERRLRELQSTAVTLEYDRIIQPSLRVTDNVRISYPAQKVNGVYTVTSQKITLDHCGTTAEEVRQTA